MALILSIGSKKQHLQSEIMQIFNICYPRSINVDTEYSLLSPVWIPRTQNERADYLSKIYDDNDWGISDIVFNWLKELWGPHSIDRFTNYLNTKLSRYNSRYCIILVPNPSILLSAIRGMKTITFVLRFLLFRGSYYMQNIAMHKEH